MDEFHSIFAISFLMSVSLTEEIGRIGDDGMGCWDEVRWGGMWQKPQI